MKRILLILNERAGVGHDRALIYELREITKRVCGNEITLDCEVVGNHDAARRKAKDFLSTDAQPALILAGGGGGTLRAVVEGVCEAGALESTITHERVCIGALRLGSGNVLAKQFGVPRDPAIALRGILANLQASRFASCCVLRCVVQADQNKSAQTHYAVTLGGFGQFGRIPADLARWHKRFPSAHRVLAHLFGIEKLTDVEYALAMLMRSVWCALHPAYAEKVEITANGQRQKMRLLAGVAMSFPLPALPFDPGLSAEDEAWSLHLIPQRGSWRTLLFILAPRHLLKDVLRIKINKGERVEIRFADRERAQCFLDEDPLTFQQKLTIEVAGSLRFVPGPLYAWTDRKGTREQ